LVRLKERHSYEDIADYIIKAGGSEDVYPYPTKEETETIFDAFDKLFQAIQTKEEGGRVIMYRVGDKENPLAINDKFNEDLSRMISGNLKIGHIFELGNPSNILQAAGIPNLPIEMSSQRLLDKSKQKNHKFDLSKVKDLPKALQNPIAIFSYGDKSKAVNIIVEIEYKGKKFLVGLSLDPAIKGIKLGINSIRSVFPKDTHEWVNWIIQGKGLYFDKEKVLNILTNSRIPADVAFGLPGNQVQQDKAELSDVNITKKPENAYKEKNPDWLGRQRSNYAEAAIPTKDITKIINTFKNPTIPSENNNLFRAIGERGASRLSNAEKVLDGLRAAKEMENIGNVDKLKDVVLNLFHKASKGDISGKSIKIGNLTANGRDYLAELAGIDMKQYVSFVINPSDLRHIYNEHYGANEKDRGQNYPLIDEDIRNMVDVILNPEKIVSFKEDGITKFIFLAKSPQDGTYNLVEVYGDKRGNLSAKSIYNTKKDVSHRAMTINKTVQTLYVQNE
jgi:hypothetical protein